MALIQCPECNRQVSDKATSCPQCGCPIAVGKDKSSLTERDNIYSLSMPIKKLSKKTIAIVVAAVVVLAIAIWSLVGGSSSGIDADVKVLKASLLDPDSLVIYQAYTNENYGDNGGRATLFYFGAKNRSGGISDDWAFVCDDSIQFESTYNAAVDEGDNQGILENAGVVFAQVQVSMGNESWQEVDIE